MKQSLYILSLTAVIICFQSSQISAQDSTLFSKAVFFPDNILNKVHAKSAAINKKIIRQTEKYLNDMEKQEQKLRRKLTRIDSTAASKIFADGENQYTILLQKIKNISGKTAGVPGKYLPHLDSLQTALKFMDQSNSLFEKNAQTDLLLKQSLGSMKLLQERFSAADQVTGYINQRKNYLQNQLAQYGLTKDLLKLKKQVYYYQARVSAYKEAFENPSLIESRAMAILKRTMLFKNFFKQHSQLAGLFRLPAATPANGLAGFAQFQTRESTEQLLVQRFGTLPDVHQVSMRQTMPGQSYMDGLKAKNKKLSRGSGEESMPDFKPDNQKTRSFIKRLEIGTNLQTVKSNYFFPSTTDIALSVGYKINDKSVVGFGSSYRVGWGKDVRHISISHQGIGLRSFVDIKLKGSFWISGGGEMNYRSEFNNFEILNNYSPWQKSALLGISKRYRVSKAVKGNALLMYDFLSKQQVPRTQPLVFRIGYILK